LTYETSNDIAHTLGSSSKLSAEQLRENPQKVQQIIDRLGLSQEEAKDLSKVSSLQANIYKFAE